VARRFVLSELLMERLMRSRHFSRMIRTFLLISLLGSLETVAQDLPKAPQAQVFTLTPAPGFFTEPGVAVNQNDPTQVVTVFQDNVHAAYSRDAGRTWQLAENVDPKNYRISGDVSAAFDNQGHAFVCYIAFDKLGTFNYWAHGATRNGIFVRRSLDGGKTWEADHFPVAEQPTAPGIPFEDKPIIVADNSKSKYAGNLYVGWTRWRIADSQIVLSRSMNDGKTWSQPIEIDAHPGLPRDDNGAAEGFDGTVGPDGTLYAVWSQDNEIMFTRSRDGGKTFSRARCAVHTAPVMFAIETLDRANGFPQIAIDPQGKRLYVSWTDYRNGDIDVFVASSDDHGKHWSAPIRVNNDPVHDGAEQFFQWLAVDPIDSSVNVVFYDRRQDSKNRKQIVVLARSTDQARTFNNYAWTDTPFEAGGYFFGDYSGLAAYGGRVYGAWTEQPAAASKGDRADRNAESTVRGTIVRVGVADFTGKRSEKP
jgi:hypothetical protein